MEVGGSPECLGAAVLQVTGNRLQLLLGLSVLGGLASQGSRGLSRALGRCWPPAPQVAV